MTLVVIDASAGVEIVCDTRRGRALARLLPAGAEGWVPEHFYVALAEQLGASLLTDDHRLVQAPTFPSHVSVLRLPTSL